MGVMRNKILEISPLRLSILCGLLSTAFSLSNNLLFSFPRFFVIFLIFSYLWLVPILFTSLMHGARYGLIAGIILIACDAMVTGTTTAPLTLSLNLLPALYLADLIHTRNNSSQMGLGTALSRVHLVYLCLMFFLLVFVFAPHTIEKAATSLIKNLAEHEIADQEVFQFLDHLAQVFPALLCLSTLLSLAINMLVTLRLLKAISPEIRPFPLANDVTVPGFWDIIFLGGLLLLLTRHELFAFIGKNVLLLSCLPLYLYGLSIIYSWLDRLENGLLWLVFVIIFSMLLVWPAMLIILLGLIGPIVKIHKSADRSS